jgi:3-oxoacyl-[acyl-carrier protein] reductase
VHEDRNRLEEKMASYPVAIVTGASRGIGKACAVGLSKSGYRAVLVARTEQLLNDVANEITARVPKQKELHPLVCPLDVTDPHKVKHLVNTVVNQTGRIDVLVNNAGITIPGTLNLKLSELDRLFETNLRAPFSMLKAVVPIMKKQKSGHIFNISSRSGKIGFAGKGGYSATKFGLVGLSESLCRELSPMGVSVTTICPAWVDTDMARQGGTQLEPEKMIQPEDIMQTLRWILSLSPAASVKEVVIECRQSIA